MQKSSYVITITVSFAAGVLLSFFGQKNIKVTILLILVSAIVLALFWSIEFIRLGAFGLTFLFLGYLYPVFLNRDLLISIKAGNPILVFFNHARHIFVGSLQHVLPEPEASLASGLVVGTDTTFPYELKKQFVNTGTIHLVAVSGFNVTVVLKIFSDWLKPLGRKIAFTTGTLGVVSFIILAGGQASVVRAGIMGWLFLLAMLNFRQFNIRNALFIAGVVMILFEPKIIKDDIGFQLSFGAMLGLIYISPIVKDFIEKNRYLTKLPTWLIAALQETLGAQVAVAFLILGYFGRLSIIAPIPNLLIVPMIFIPMFLTIGIGFLAILLKTTAVFFTLPLVCLLKYILGVINLFDFKGGSLQFEQFNWYVVILAYAIIVLLIRFYYIRRRKYVLVA